MQTDILLSEILNSGIPVRISGQIVSISGQVVIVSGQFSGMPVSVSGQIVNISGQVVNISGQTSGIPVVVSGQMLDRTWQLSGLTDSVAISGQVVIISGQFVTVSGQPVLIAGQNILISGQTIIAEVASGITIPVIISGQPISVSGQMLDRTWQLSGLTDSVAISGQVVIISGQFVNISGQVVNVDGQSVIISGQPVGISGQRIDRTWQLSGLTDSVAISGQTIVAELASGVTIPVSISGQPVVISGQMLNRTWRLSGLTDSVAISGQTIIAEFASGITLSVSISGQPVGVSGQVVNVSGQMLNRTWQLSGLTDSVAISGQTIVAEFASGVSLLTSISGQPVVVSGQVVIISGQFISVSGQPVLIAGQNVLVSGQTVITEFASGVSLPVFVSGQPVLISGQVVTVDVSGQTVNISGQLLGRTWQLSGLTDSVAISGQTIIAEFASGVTLPISISGQSVGISGQTIIAEFASGISIPVNISGQTVGISGQRLDRTWQLSGLTDSVAISGQVVIVSGQFVSISGQPVLIAGQNVFVSGQTVITEFASGVALVVSVSGQPVLISGQVVSVDISGQMLGRTWQLSGLTDSVAISGQTIVAEFASGVTLPMSVSGQPIVISGQTIVAEFASGVSIPANISGQTVRISGQSLDRTWQLSGLTDSVAISGQTIIVEFASGTSLPTSISGQFVLVSGQPILVSGQPILVSGQPILVSGQPVLISGQPISSGNIIDAGNSTTTPLGAGATFTGTSKDLTGFSQVSIMAFTDQNSAVNGLQIQYSTDNINFDHIHTSTVTANDSISLHYPVDAKFYRVVYINGGTIQTVFRLQTNLKPIVSIGTIKDIGLPLLASDDSVTTHSVITGITTAGGGAYVDVKVSPSGDIQVAGTLTALSGSITNISGNVVRISGQVINVSGQMSGQPVSISGQMLNRTWQLSGLTDSVAISGQTVVVEFASGISIPVNVSGQTVGISGQSIVIELASGVSIPTSISGQPVQVSGQTIIAEFASGISIPVNISGQTVGISGQVVIVSGQISGAVVNISGQMLDRTWQLSGLTDSVAISGQTVVTQFASGVTLPMSISGQIVGISGQVVNVSGQFSGMPIRISGQIVNVAGQNMGRTWTLDKSTDSVSPMLVRPDASYYWFIGNMSGSLIVNQLSGENTVTISGQPVSISGQVLSVEVSGQPIQLAGLNITPSLISSYYNVIGSSFTNAVMTSDGALMIADGNVIDPNNSTTTLLGAGGFFIGQRRDLTGYSQITIFVGSDVPSATNGLQVQFFDFELTAVARIKFYTISAPQTIHVPVNAKYYRILYINNAGIPQTTFALQSILNPIPSVGTIRELDMPISYNDDAMTTQSIIAGENVSGLGTYSKALVTIDGNLQTLSFISGQVVNVSGAIVKISGQVVNISGQMSGAVANISGQVVNISGQMSGAVMNISGAVINISGQLSGQSIIIIGTNSFLGGTYTQALVDTTGRLLTAISGQIVGISGQVVNISGQMSGAVANISGQAVNVSGQGITILGQNIVGLPADTRFNVVGSSFSELVATSGGALMVANGLEPDANNFSDTALGIGATYAGGFRDLTGYSQITINVVTDVPGTLNVNFSTSFVGGGTETKSYSILGLYPETIHIPVNAKFYRISYTNGAVGQIIFRMQSLLSPIPSVGVVRNIDRPIAAKNDAMITHTVIAGPIDVGGSSFIDNVVLPAGQSLVQINQSGQVFGVDGYNKALIQEDIVHRKIHQGLQWYADVSQSAGPTNYVAYAIATMSGVNPHLSWHIRGLVPGTSVSVLEIMSGRQTTGTISSTMNFNRTVAGASFTSTRVYSSYVIGSNVGSVALISETMASGESAYGFGNLYTYPLIPGEFILKGGFTYIFQVALSPQPTLTTFYANWYESGLA